MAQLALGIDQPEDQSQRLEERIRQRAQQRAGQQPEQAPEQRPEKPAEKSVEKPAEKIIEKNEPVLESNPYKQEPPKERTHAQVTENIREKVKALRKGRPRSEKSRAAIIKATTQLLLHTSVQELSIEAIARKAKVGKTTIYRWWPNKTAVVMEALANQPAMHAPMPTARNNAEALVMQLEKLIRLLQSKNGETIAQLFSEAQGDQKSQEIFENSFLSPLMDSIEFSIEEGQNAGEFNSELDRKLAMDILCGPIFFRLMAHPANFNEDFQQTWPREAVKLLK